MSTKYTYESTKYSNTNITCPVCQTLLDDDKNSEKAKSAAISRYINFYKCCTCDCWFAPEAASLAQTLYKERASNNYAPNKSTWMKAVQRIYLGRYYGAYAKKYGAASVVDYGCGNGVLANALHSKDLSVFAVDVQNERPVNLNPEISYQNTESIVFPKNKGRTIFILRHVLEHFEHPIQEINKITALAISGDMFIIETPSGNSLFKVILKDGWPGYFPPYHVTVPTLATLCYIANSAGLVLLGSCKREPPIIGGYFARNSKVTLNLHRLIGLLLYPAQIIASKISGLSEAIEVILEKP